MIVKQINRERLCKVAGGVRALNAAFSDDAEIKRLFYEMYKTIADILLTEGAHAENAPAQRPEPDSIQRMKEIPDGTYNATAEVGQFRVSVMTDEEE